MEEYTEKYMEQYTNYKEKHNQLEKEYATKLALMTPLKQDGVLQILYKRKFDTLNQEFDTLKQDMIDQTRLQIKTHHDSLQEINRKLEELYVQRSCHSHAELVKNRLHDFHTDRLHKKCSSIMASELTRGQKKKLCLAASIRTFIYHLSLEDRYNHLKLELM